MLPQGNSRGGAELLKQYAANSNPLAPLNDSIQLLTTSVDKLNDAIVDLVDIEEEDLESESTGRKTKRRRQKITNLKYKWDKSSSQFRLGDEKDQRKEDLREYERGRTPFRTFESDSNKQDLEFFGRIIEGSITGLGNIFKRMMAPIQEIAEATRGGRGGLGALGLGALALTGIVGAGVAAAASESVSQGVARGQAGRATLDTQPPVNQQNGEGQRRFQNRANPNITPEQQQQNREAIQQEEQRIEQERRENLDRRLREQYAIPNRFDNNILDNDVEPVEQALDAIIKRLESDDGQKNDATPDEFNLSPYYQNDLNPRDLITPTMGPVLAQAAGGAGVMTGEGAIIGGGTMAQRMQRNQRAGEGAAISAITEALRTIVEIPRRIFGSSSANMDEAARLNQEHWDMVREGRYPAPPIPEVPTAPNIPAPTAVPTPQAPVTVPRVDTPPAPPTPVARDMPQAPPAVEPVARPAPPVAVPTPQAPAIARPDVIRPPIAQPQAVPVPQAQAIPANPPAVAPIPPPPPAPLPTPPIPPARQPVVVMQAPQPPPYVPPQINMPRASGGENIGRGRGFAPLPPAPPSPTTRTPSYPQRGF